TKALEEWRKGRSSRSAGKPRTPGEGRMAKAPSLRKDWTRGSRRTRKAVHGECSVEPTKREGTLRVTLGDEIEGAEPDAVKASSTVPNGGREETCLASAGNAPCAYPPRWGEPALLSLVDARLSALVSPPPRAHPALSSFEDPSGLDAGLPGRSDRAWGH